MTTSHKRTIECSRGLENQASFAAARRVDVSTQDAPGIPAVTLTRPRRKVRFRRR